MKSRVGPLARRTCRRGCRRARQTWCARLRGRKQKSLRGVGHPTGFFSCSEPEGWTSRHTQARRGLVEPLHGCDGARRHAACFGECCSACGDVEGQRISCGAHGGIHRGRMQNKKPGGCGLPGFVVVELRRPSLRMESSRAVVCLQTCPRAAKPPRVCGRRCVERGLCGQVLLHGG